MFVASSQLISVLSLQLLICSLCQPVATSDFGKASGKQCPTISDYLRQVAAARPGERAGERVGAGAARGEVVRERRPAAVRGAGARVAAAVRAAV